MDYKYTATYYRQGDNQCVTWPDNLAEAKTRGVEFGVVPFRIIDERTLEARIFFSNSRGTGYRSGTPGDLAAAIRVLRDLVVYA